MREIQKRFVAKTETTDTPGEFQALVSVFGNTDSQGDIVDKGAFADSIAKYAGDDNMPVIFSHQWNDLNAWLGTYTKMEETDEGLLLTGLLDIDESPTAKRAYELMKNRRLREFSFGGRVTKEQRVELPDDGGVEYHLQSIDLWEAGPTFKGANSETQLLSVKALDGIAQLRDTVATKEGRVLAQKHVESLQSARDSLDAVLSAVQKDDDQGEGKAADAENSDVTKHDPVTLDHNVMALLSLATIGTNQEGDQ